MHLNFNTVSSAPSRIILLLITYITLHSHQNILLWDQIPIQQLKFQLKNLNKLNSSRWRFFLI